ncbi:thrombospondin-1-like [Argopecten irradians]|uniref:thrombospondin-1-like n=1 Tax=Argopecten irradians TaxID=31199 RepID=UPI0037100A2D
MINFVCTNVHCERHQYCDAYGDFSNTLYMEPRCNAHGGWNNWGCWSECSGSCESGTKLRSRRCDNPRPLGSGSHCQGQTTETLQCRPCDLDPCLSNPCLGDGNCSLTESNSIVCECTNEYNGSFCQESMFEQTNVI